MGIKEYINSLLKQEISFFDISEEYRLNQDIVTIERKLGIRVSGRRGYDVIRRRLVYVGLLI